MAVRTNEDAFTLSELDVVLQWQNQMSVDCIQDCIQDVRAGYIKGDVMQAEYCRRCGTPLTEWETGPLCEGCGIDEQVDSLRKDAKLRFTAKDVRKITSDKKEPKR